ncbi:MAG: LysE family translocator [Shewanella sp.]
MDYSLLLTLSVLHFIALVSPGPDFAIIVKLASQQNRTVALACAFGIATAILIHCALSLTGMGILIANSVLAYTIIQLMGAAYLAWIGIGALTSAFKQWQATASTQKQTLDDKEQTIAAKPMATHRGFLIGFYTNLLNPKAMLFFITLLSALVPPDLDLATKITASGLFFALTALWFGGLAIVISKGDIKSMLERNSRYVDLITGILFVAVSVMIIRQLLLTL